jgi:hypothetical protein
MPTVRFCIRILFLIILLTSCSPGPTATKLPLATVTRPQPTQAETATLGNGSMFKSGLSYSDASGDMPISFLDVVGFQATVDETSETLKIVLHMRDIPETATRGQVTNLVEYAWMVFVYLDPSQAIQTDQPGDYCFALNTTIEDPLANTNRPTPGTPVAVPIYQLFENNGIYNSSGISISTPNVDVNPDRDTLTLTGRVPGIKSNAVFGFHTEYFDGTSDRPDNYARPPSGGLSTPQPQATPLLSALSENSNDRLIPAGTIHAFPGPEHYAGDVLTFEITNDGSFGDGTIDLLMSLDNQEPTRVFATSSWTGLLLPDALDTTNLSGQHTLQFKTADGNFNETYSFEVLPVSQRPANETHASWLVKETDCCIFHTISETAAARDIDFISEHFQKGAEQFSTITGSKINTKLNIYLIDRLWGNGGFGGGGELLICYTDRYYGPTVNAEGLEVLARHEFTHATGLDSPTQGNGIDFNYEGLAVYTAGGHYKLEPLAERGAALYDLGYYVPVEQSLDIRQHELSYLYPAAMLTYISESYGAEKIEKFLNADDNPDDGQPGSLEAAILSTFGVTLKDFDRGFKAWLEGHEPGEQLIDLRLTIELQDLRRQYQDTYSPAPRFLLAETPDTVTRPEYLPMVMREAHAPANMAVELIFASGQRALFDGNYPQVEALDKVLAEILDTGRFESPIARDYLDIVLAAAGEGYEVVNLDIQGDHAQARVTTQPPLVTDLGLQRVNGIWQIQP